MSESAFIIKVPEAEPYVDALRRQYDPVAPLGVPAHITLLYPFKAPEQITDDDLATVRTALHTSAAFNFTLQKVARFPLTTYLAPEPADPFVALTVLLTQVFPAYPPYEGKFATIVPHLTAADGNADDAQVAGLELVKLIASHGPIMATCNAVSLFGNYDGLWKEICVFDFGN